MASGRGTARDAERLLELLNALGSTTFRQLLWQKSAPLDLTYAQSQVLFYVGDNPGCRMGDVAKAFAVTLPAVTQTVDRLEQKQFVVRAADPADRRRAPAGDLRPGGAGGCRARQAAEDSMRANGRLLVALALAALPLTGCS